MRLCADAIVRGAVARRCAASTGHLEALLRATWMRGTMTSVCDLGATSLGLARMFLSHATSAVAAAFAQHPDLDAALLRLHGEGRAAWPGLDVSAPQLASFLARQLPPEAAAPDVLAGLRARELYLICAFNLRQAQAQTILQTEYMPGVRRALLDHGVADSLIPDIQQELLSRLIEKQDPAVLRRGYSGLGELAGWLRTVAVRDAELRRKRGQRELPIDSESEPVLRDSQRNPESALLAGSLKKEFHTAFREAVAALSRRERNLLRYHFLMRLSIDQIGDIYHVHRSTAARWVARAEEQLIRQTRERFTARVGVTEQSLPNVLEQFLSQVSINLGSLLHEAAGGEA